ncbi:MAG: transposase [Kiritimatiellae bacterium]|jgi:putative transposase|nr:transposase [Kiritimatiellia bacterium]
MPRALRIEYPGAHYHAMCRGNNGQEIFLNDDGRLLFLSTLNEVCEQTGWLIHAYVLMSNHYHLLIETPESNLVAGMKWFQGAYTQRFNSMFKRRGHLYQGRYKAIPIATDPRDGGLEYFREVSTYIHLNPFRANLYGEGMDKPLQSYAWSSYPSYCGLVRRRPKWLVREKVLKSWEVNEGEAWSLRSYREKMERFMRFEEDPSAGIRGEFDRQIKRGWYIGSEEFREKLDEFLKGRTQNDNFRGNQRREHSEWEAERLIKSALETLEWKEEDLLVARSVVPEKQAVAWLIKSHTAVTGHWIAERLQMGHPENTSRGINRFRRAETAEIQDLKKRMSKCVG